MAEAIGCGDAHFDGHITKHVPNAHNYIAHELSKPCMYARRHGIKHVFWYGDTCQNHRMSYESHVAMISLFNKFPDLKFDIILGNHDMIGRDYRAGHSLELLMLARLPNVRVHVKPTNLMIEGARVRFLPYPYDGFDRTALNVAHIDVKGAKHENGTPVKSDFTSDAVAVIGHQHTKQRVRNMHFSGTMYQTRFGESEEKFFHHIRFNSPDDYDIRNIRTTPDVLLTTLIVNKPEDLNIDPRKGELFKLHIQDGVDVSPSDWSHLRVVSTNAFTSRAEATETTGAELAAGEQVQFSVPEFLEAHLTASGSSPDEVSSLMGLREHILRRDAAFGPAKRSK